MNTPLHMPADPDKFEFDGEVAKVFPEMAARSIPLFHEAHTMHARMLAPWAARPGVSVLDVGASRGQFFASLQTANPSMAPGRMVAIDKSPAMCEMLRNEWPSTEVIEADLLELFIARIGRGRYFLRDAEKPSLGPGLFDIVALNYTLQFVKPGLQELALSAVADRVKPGGVLVMGHKLRIPDFMGRMLHDQYVNFRRDQGFSDAEIAAKTKALESVMFPVDEIAVINLLHTKGFRVGMTTRHSVFATYFCTKEK